MTGTASMQSGAQSSSSVPGGRSRHGEGQSLLARVTSARCELGTGAPSIHRLYPEKGRLRPAQRHHGQLRRRRDAPAAACMTRAGRWRAPDEAGLALAVAVANPLDPAGAGGRERERRPADVTATRAYSSASGPRRMAQRRVAGNDGGALAPGATADVTQLTLASRPSGG
ncbi:hypothetical protein GQ55_8G219600 [Panicum hallii var. hallii]|uniref:Uncharacterized protein n=1 Tax=Panicum hallii var. hallii TaxID=1504633 RepID=A0A2T7CPX1_9POAL|nr:hypothetical protein GQ55_8G219600 [Panicum hallii var. hallii]